MRVSDEDNAGMYWIKILQKENDSIAVDVQRMILAANGAQGLTWFGGELYANVNGKGLFRMSDTDDDQILDNLQFLKGPQSPSDHGNHALVPAPDSSGIYVINGNHTPLPEKYSSRVANWAEDILLSRQWRMISIDRKSTRLNSSHVAISYAVFCLKKKKSAG